MIITIEGNIGAGKTSFAESLFKTLKNAGHPVVYIPEPVDSWKNVGGANLLEMLYSDRARWTFLFQVNALLQMTDIDKQALEYSKNGLVVVKERSAYSTSNIFIPLVSEYISAAERHVLDQLSTTTNRSLFSEINQTSDITIYLRTDPETCYLRVNKRGRPEEMNGRVNMRYLLGLHAIHEQQFSKTFGTDRLIVADGNNFDMNDPASVQLYGGGWFNADNLINQSVIQPNSK